jgi:hypothetical protein
MGGIMSVPLDSGPLVPTSTYRDGRMHPPGMMNMLVTNSAAVLQRLQIGARAYLVNLEYALKSDKFVLVIFVCGACNGTMEDVGSRAAVAFQFPKGALRTATAEQADVSIAQVFSLDPAAGPVGSPAPPPAEVVAQAPPESALGTYVGSRKPENFIRLNADGTFALRQQGQDFAGTFTVDGGKLTLSMNGSPFSTVDLRADRIVEPDDIWIRQGNAAANPQAPPQPQTKTIALGQTIDEVVAMLGQPEKIAKVGAKEIYYYKDLKITFQSGKVSDVQ